MFILYIDGSGTPELLDPNNNLYVLTGVCVHEGTWFALEKRVANLKRSYALEGADFELHAKDFCVSISEQGRIGDFELLAPVARKQAVTALRQAKLASVHGEQRDSLKKKFRSTEPFVHLTRRERSSLLEDGLDLVGSHDGIRLFGEAVDKRHLGQTSAMEHAFAQVISRFDTFLTQYNRNNRGSFPSSENGLLVMDREPTYEKQIEAIFSSYRTRGHPWGPINHVIESPFFVDSAKVNAVQVVDLCSYAVRRYIERADQPQSHEEQNFLRIFHKFDRSGPKLHGVRHYCPKNSCQCLICRDRGHSPNA